MLSLCDTGIPADEGTVGKAGFEPASLKRTITPCFCSATHYTERPTHWATSPGCTAAASALCYVDFAVLHRPPPPHWYFTWFQLPSAVLTDGGGEDLIYYIIKALLTSLPVQQGKAQQSFLCVSLTSPLWGACSQNEKTRKIRAAEILEIHILFVDITAWAVYCQLPRPLFEN